MDKLRSEIIREEVTEVDANLVNMDSEVVGIEERDLTQSSGNDVLGLVSLEDGNLDCQNAKSLIGHSSSLREYFKEKPCCDNSGASFFDSLAKDTGTEHVVDTKSPKPLENGILAENVGNLETTTNKRPNGNRTLVENSQNTSQDSNSNHVPIPADTRATTPKLLEIAEINSQLEYFNIENNELISTLPSKEEDEEVSNINDGDRLSNDKAVDSIQSVDITDVDLEFRFINTDRSSEDIRVSSPQEEEEEEEEEQEVENMLVAGKLIGDKLSDSATSSAAAISETNPDSMYLNNEDSEVMQALSYKEEEEQENKTVLEKQDSDEVGVSRRDGLSSGKTTPEIRLGFNDFNTDNNEVIQASSSKENEGDSTMVLEILSSVEVADPKQPELSSGKTTPEIGLGFNDINTDNNEVIQASSSKENEEDSIVGLDRINSVEVVDPKQPGSSLSSKELKPSTETSPQVCKIFSSVSEANGKLNMVTNHFGDVGLRPNTFDDVVESAPWASDDPFGSVIRKSEAEQRRDAWIANARTKQCLVTVSKTTPGSYFPDKDQLTMPGVVLAAEQGDPIRDFVLERLGAEVATQRSVMTADEVPQDEFGLKRLLERKCYRAAVNLTSRLLKQAGQGVGRLGHPSSHTPNSIQVWFLRISLLMKLGLFAAALAEAEAFGNADKPDLFYEFYPDTYGKRKGSMFPFSFRILLCEVYLFNNKFKEALDHLCGILSVVRQILKNLEDNLSEDGEPVQLSDQYRKASTELWKGREIKVMYAVLNSTVVQQDYHSAVSLLNALREKDTGNNANLWSAQGRILLQLGDIKAAQSCFAKAAAFRADSENTAHRVSALVDRSVMCICQNNFAEAYAFLQQARELDPKNPMVLNNSAVCLLYMCKMRAALRLLEDAIHTDTQTFLQECIVFNICTLYELESSNSVNKKLRVLEIVNRHGGDAFNVSYLKIPPKDDKK